MQLWTHQSFCQSYGAHSFPHSIDNIQVEVHRLQYLGLLIVGDGPPFLFQLPYNHFSSSHLGQTTTFLQQQKFSGKVFLLQLLNQPTKKNDSFWNFLFIFDSFMNFVIYECPDILKYLFTPHRGFRSTNSILQFFIDVKSS